MRNIFTWVSNLAVTSLLARLALGHISLIYPCPRYSPHGEKCPALPPGEKLDTAETTLMNGPINSLQLGGTMPLCRHKTPYATPSATWTAGDSVTVKFNPNAATHSGGHCEFSISYDGENFAVIHQVLQSCFRNGIPKTVDNVAEVLQYTIKLPADLPASDKAIFAWTWVNASGNREFYMNCADIAIKGGTSTSYTGKRMTIVNYPDYPSVDEFNGDYNTGMELYTSGEQIEISPSGTKSLGNMEVAGNAGGTSDSDKLDPEDSNGTVSVSKSNKLSTSASGTSTGGQTVAPSSVAGQRNVAKAGAPADESGGTCGSVIMQCSGTGYQMCVNGAWSPTYPCGAGTACQAEGGTVFCGWP